ncbi:MAG: 16S rRNA (cytidine(1402)-2'-O)-methyltransferase [Acidimicrobiia bacterium]
MEQLIPGLYIVATPIGNLEEITKRALFVLENADYLFCEDTRELKKLISIFNIKTEDKRIISLHEHNEMEKAQRVVGLISEGKVVAYTSDAGMPAISDPGSKLVNEVLNAQQNVFVVSGASAVINAVAQSGFDTSEFTFLGFFPRTAKDEKKFVEKLKRISHTVVFFESPKRISKTLKLLVEEIPDTRAVVCRELTKKFEEVNRDKISELSKKYNTETKGECVVVIEGLEPQFDADESKNEIEKAIKLLKRNKVSVKDSIEILAPLVGMPKNEIKKIYLED